MRRLAAVEVELKSLEYIELRTLASISSGGAPGAESSFLKLIGTEIHHAYVLLTTPSQQPFWSSNAVSLKLTP